MKCEQFLFEAAYLTGGDPEDLGRDARNHLNECVSCFDQFQKLQNGECFKDTDSAALMAQRLHFALDAAIAEEAAKSLRNVSLVRLWPQVALSLLILVASIAGIAFQNHPTAPTPMYVRR
jgi:hypothetical protein